MRPRFRADLTGLRLDYGGIPLVHLENSVRQVNARLYEIEYRIAQLMDGTRDVAALAAAAAQQYNFEASEADLENFVRHLEDLGLVKFDKADNERQPLPQFTLTTPEGENLQAPAVVRRPRAVKTLAPRLKRQRRRLPRRTGVAVLLLLLVAAGWWWQRDSHRGEPGAAVAGARPVVRLMGLVGERMVVTHTSEAAALRPPRQVWLGFAEAGRVAGGLPAEGTRVEADEPVAALELPVALRPLWEQGRRDLAQARTEHEKWQRQVASLVAEQEAWEAVRAQAQERLRRARSQALARGGGVGPSDMAEWTQETYRANTMLTQLARAQREPRQQEQRTRQAVVALERRFAVDVARWGAKVIRAPFAGRIAAVRLVAGEPVAAGAEGVLLRQMGTVQLEFRFAPRAAPAVEVGAATQVVVAGGLPRAAKVVDKQERRGAWVVAVELPDPTGAYAALPAERFAMVRAVADPGFRLPNTAVQVVRHSRGEGAGAVRTPTTLQAGWVWVVGPLQRVHRVDVEILAWEAHEVWVRDAQGELQEHTRVVVEVVSARRWPWQSAPSLMEGAEVEVLSE